MQGLLAKWLVTALIPLAKTDFLLARIFNLFSFAMGEREHIITFKLYKKISNHLDTTSLGIHLYPDYFSCFFIRFPFLSNAFQSRLSSFGVLMKKKSHQMQLFSRQIVCVFLYFIVNNY